MTPLYFSTVFYLEVNSVIDTQ